LRTGCVEALTFAVSIRLLIKAIAKKAASTRIADAKPAMRFGWIMLAVTGASTVNNDLVATLHDENVFHGVTAADSCQINYRSPRRSCKKYPAQLVGCQRQPSGCQIK